MPFFSSKPTSEDLTGLSTFFDFLCAVFSRIAYSEVPMPLFLLSGVLRIIPKKLLLRLREITDISKLNQDEQDFFNLNDPSNELLISKGEDDPIVEIRTYNGKKYINFIPYAEKINNLIEDTSKSPYYKQITNPDIQMDSIATSNYGIVLIIGIKFIPNLIFTSFRGTYSTKTAQSYIQMSSASPVEISAGKKVLKGIAKIEFEMLHTILASNNNIATKFLGGSNIIPVFTGHSLGGAMATILDYEYCDIVEKKGNQYFSPLLPTPVCISFGAPRVLSKTTSEKLCDKIVNGKTIVRRYTNDGDLVTALPPAPVGFYHPCSSDRDKSMDRRKMVSRDCKSSTRVSVNLARSDYTKAINCRDKEPTMLTKAINAGQNMFDHMTYLYISFAKAADITHLFGKSAFTINTTEVGRVNSTNEALKITEGDTEMYIYQMIGNSGVGEYTLDNIDLVKLRRKGDTILHEDSLMNNKIFSDILYVKKDTVNVSFGSDGLPIPFSKKIGDQQLEDYEDEKYKEDLAKSMETTFGQIPVGGRRKNKRKTRRKVNKLTKRKSRKRKTRKYF